MQALTSRQILDRLVSFPTVSRGSNLALVDWLEDRGVKNIEALNAVLAKGAKPWWDFYGGKGNIEVV